jgi:hypothetical protein
MWGKQGFDTGGGGDGTDNNAIHDNVANEIAVITEKVALHDDDLFLIEDSQAANVKKRVKKSNVVSGITANPEYQLYAGSFENPTNSDWTVNSLAPIGRNASNNALLSRLFDDTTEEGVGFSVKIPSGVTNIIFDFVSRAASAPGGASQVRPVLYTRTLGDNVAVGAWDSGTDLTLIDIPTNANYQYDSQTISLASLSLVAGNLIQFELTRDPADASDDLVGDWELILLKISFS